MCGQNIAIVIMICAGWINTLLIGQYALINKIISKNFDLIIYWNMCIYATILKFSITSLSSIQ